MRNEIETSLFLPAGQVLYFRCKEKVNPYHSAFMVKKDKGKPKHLYMRRGPCSLGVYCFTPGGMSHTLEQDTGCGLVDN